MKKQEQKLVGLFFHSFKDGEMFWQGRVAGNPEPGWYLVELHSWFDGGLSNLEIVRIESMSGWWFYDNAEDWNAAADVRAKAKPQGGI